MGALAHLRQQQSDPAYAISTKVLLDAILELTDQVEQMRGRSPDSHRALLNAIVG